MSNKQLLEQTYNNLNSLLPIIKEHMDNIGAMTTSDAAFMHRQTEMASNHLLTVLNNSIGFLDPNVEYKKNRGIA